MRNTTQVRYSVRESNGTWLALKLNVPRKSELHGRTEIKNPSTRRNFQQTANLSQATYLETD
jgi:hypothetical protein